MTPPRKSNATKNARHGYILSLVREEKMSNQSQLLARLQKAGIEVTQATLSRDLNELGVRKIRTKAGARYVIEGEFDSSDFASRAADRLRQKISELAVMVDSSYGFLVLRTPPGAAQYLASFVDRASLDEIVGCTAGDDTVFILAREPYKGEDIAHLLLEDFESESDTEAVEAKGAE